jgi:Tol biopolymer transport system component
MNVVTPQRVRTLSKRQAPRQPLSRPGKVRFTFDSGVDSAPFWSPDGSEIAFWSEQPGYIALCTARLDGSIEAKPVVVQGKILRAWFGDWLSNGCIFTAVYAAEGGPCYIRRRVASDEWEAVPINVETKVDGYPQFSPDDRFVASWLRKAGTGEIYVRDFPDASGKWQISPQGGTQVRWSSDGKEIVYVEGDTLVSVPVSTKPSFSMGKPKRLFSDPALQWEWGAPNYDVSANGQRFVLMEPAGTVRKGVIQVVQSWFAEFQHSLGEAK